MNDDASLLRAYAEQESEAAFTELVRRHLDIVYGAALRRTGGDTHSAADVAQQVFTNLARHARKLSRHAVLSAWLHTATRNAALNLMISDQRRKAREVAALALDASGESRPEWERVRPLLDEAIDGLPEADRAAVVLRYLERREFADIGGQLGLSADAARMRVDRALEKLRAALAHRGVKSTSTALATVFANQVGATAPLGLATSISSAALASAGAGGVAAAGFGIFMSKTTTTIGAIALVALALLYFQWSRAFRAESELAALTADRDGLRADLRVAQQDAARTARELAALREEVDALKPKPVTAPSVRPANPVPVVAANDPARLAQDEAVLANLRQISASVERFALERGRPPTSLDELIGEGKIIKRLVTVANEDYSSLSLAPGGELKLTMANGDVVSYKPPGPPTPEQQRAAELWKQIKPAAAAADAAYRAANNGAAPLNPEALIPYFATPQQGADFVEYREAQKIARESARPK